MPGPSTSDEKLAAIASISQNQQLRPEEKNARILQLVRGEEGSERDAAQAKGHEADSLSAQEKLTLIYSNLQETLNPEIVEDVSVKQQRPLTVYWGSATTGRPHCGYFVPMLKIASFLRAGCQVKILLADIHGFLDNLKAPIELVKYRAEYYKHAITSLLVAVGVSVERLEFVLGSSYQLTPSYQMDLLRLCTLVTIHDAKKAGSEVVKQVENATLSGLIYPLLQSLDEQYLGVDAQFGGVDQRKIFALAKDVLPKIGYKERAHFMNPMIPGLAGGKMSASDPDSKIDVLDAPEVVTKKLKRSYAAPKEVEGNGVLTFVQYVLLPAGALKHGRPRFIVERRDAEPLVYEEPDKMFEDYRADILTPQTLKPAVTKALIALLEPIQEAYKASPEWQEVERLAYPPHPGEAKKKKPKKDKGTRAPNRNVEAQPDGSLAGPDSEKDKASLAGSAGNAIKELRIEKEVLDQK